MSKYDTKKCVIVECNQTEMDLKSEKTQEFKEYILKIKVCANEKTK